MPSLARGIGVHRKMVNNHRSFIFIFFFLIEELFFFFNKQLLAVVLNSVGSRTKGKQQLRC